MSRKITNNGTNAVHLHIDVEGTTTTLEPGESAVIPTPLVSVEPAPEGPLQVRAIAGRPSTVCVQSDASDKL